MLMCSSSSIYWHSKKNLASSSGMQNVLRHTLTYSLNMHCAHQVKQVAQGLQKADEEEDDLTKMHRARKRSCVE